jgi:hypothetical protein
MDSEKIKAIVGQVKALTRGEQQVDEVMEAMTRDMARSPNFAVAIIQRLRDAGIDLLDQDGETGLAFKAKFRPHVERLGERELTQIKKISGKLFQG